MDLGVGQIWLNDFSKKILSQEPISVFNYGKMRRDFAFIDDIVEGTYLCSLKPPKYNLKIDSNASRTPNKIFNIGLVIQLIWSISLNY